MDDNISSFPDGEKTSISEEIALECNDKSQIGISIYGLVNSLAVFFWSLMARLIYLEMFICSTLTI